MDAIGLTVPTIVAGVIYDSSHGRVSYTGPGGIKAGIGAADDGTPVI